MPICRRSLIHHAYTSIATILQRNAPVSDSLPCPWCFPLPLSASLPLVSPHCLSPPPSCLSQLSLSLSLLSLPLVSVSPNCLSQLSLSLSLCFFLSFSPFCVSPVSVSPLLSLSPLVSLPFLCLSPSISLCLSVGRTLRGSSCNYKSRTLADPHLSIPML